MASVNEIEKEIEKVEYLYNLSRNENERLAFKKKINDLYKSLNNAKDNNIVEKTNKVEHEQHHEPKKDNNDINRGKVVEPGSNIPDNNKSEEKEKREDNNKKSNRN